MKDRKTCRECGVSKALSAYYAHPTCADGRDTRCKECTRASTKLASRERRERQAPPPRSPGEHVTRRFEDPADCADCGVTLSRNRRVVLMGETLCSPCRAARFGFTSESG